MSQTATTKYVTVGDIIKCYDCKVSLSECMGTKPMFSLYSVFIFIKPILMLILRWFVFIFVDNVNCYWLVMRWEEDRSLCEVILLVQLSGQHRQ